MDHIFAQVQGAQVDQGFQPLYVCYGVAFKVQGFQACVGLQQT